MQAAPATVLPPPYSAGMQAASPQQQQQQQVYPQPVLTQHQLPPQQVQIPMQDGYGAAVAGSIHSMLLAHGLNHSAVSLSGQKRDSSGAPVHGGRDTTDGSFVKLFVGSVPRTITEDEVRPMFAEHGNVLEVAIIKDKRTGNQQGASCVVTSCLWLYTCLQFKVFKTIVAYLTTGAHMVRMCTTFLRLTHRHLCGFILDVVRLRQVGVIERRVIDGISCRDRGSKVRTNVVRILCKIHRTSGSLTEENFILHNIGSIIINEIPFVSSHSHMNVEVCMTCCGWLNNGLKNCSVDFCFVAGFF